MLQAPDIANLLRKLQDILISRSVNEHASDNMYQTVRDQLLSEPSVKGLLPQFVRDCSNLGKFWRFIQREYSAYKERREYRIAEFAPLLARYGRTSSGKASAPDLHRAREVPTVARA